MNSTVKRFGFLGLLLAVPFVLVGCFVGGETSPFELEKGEIILDLEGTIRPFSVPVSSYISHRLEKDNRLQAFLASEAVRLVDYEKSSVLASGVWRMEEGQKFFVVTEVEVLDVEEEIEDEGIVEEYTSETIYAPLNGGDYGFLFPDVWDYVSETDTKKRFFLREDEEQDIFFTFAVEPYDGGVVKETSDLAYGEEAPVVEDTKPDMNVEIAGLRGIKEVERKGSFEYQDIHLFSEKTGRVYMFAFRSQTSNRDRKRAFNTLLTSLADGEDEFGELMTRYEEDMQKREEAEKEKESIFNDQNDEDEIMEDNEDEENMSEETEAENSDEEEVSESVSSSEGTPSVVVDFSEVQGNYMDGMPSDFVMLVDDRAHAYTSSAYGLSLRVPYTLWFRNFGSFNGSVTTLGFATEDSLTDAATAEFTLSIERGQPPVDFVEKKSDGMVRYEWARNDDQYFVMEGAESLRDQMLSIISTIE